MNAVSGQEIVSIAVAHLVTCTEAEGPGKRFALWFQGCPLRCPGCCNPEFLPFTGGTPRSLVDLIQAMLTAQAAEGIEGITLLGGEPFAHAEAAAAIAMAAHDAGLSVMVFTGYTLEELQQRQEPGISELLAATDLLVDGPYRREEPEYHRRWIGSRNQRIHFLTPRYHPDDPCWQHRNTLEIRVRGDELQVNGFPAAGAKSLWKGWQRSRQKAAGSPPG
jgi:anaerobic ribonucleoside-triphosphate reductase activating protein